MCMFVLGTCFCDNDNIRKIQYLIAGGMIFFTLENVREVKIKVAIA